MTVVHRVEIQRGDRTEELFVPDNANLREVFLRHGIPLYRGLARFRNCEGKARCGTCRIQIIEGEDSLSTPSPFERKHPASSEGSRLACQANVRGAVRIRI